MENTNNDFLPSSYEIPRAEGKYFKPKDGENRFRILSSAIIGYVGWNKTGEKPKPIRKKVDEKFEVGEVDQKKDKIKHFWAFAIWNVESKKVQILEITQKTIMDSIKALTQDEDWGDVTGYDIVVTRTGEKLETKYTTTPKPHKELDQEAKNAWAEVKPKFDLNKMFTDENPFGDDDEDDEKKDNTDWDPDNIEKDGNTTEPPECLK